MVFSFLICFAYTSFSNHLLHFPLTVLQPCHAIIPVTYRNSCTVAQKTAPMFTHLSLSVLVWDADIIQGPETFVQKTIPSYLSKTS